MQHAAEEGKKGGSSPPDNKYKITKTKVSFSVYRWPVPTFRLSDSYVIPTHYRSASAKLSSEQIDV